MESYRIKTVKDSGITNDPNDWAKEHGEPGYILNLLLAVIGLSMRTLEMVDRLSKLELGPAKPSQHIDYKELDCL